MHYYRQLPGIFILSVITACTTTSPNPLSDMREMKPATIMDAPLPVVLDNSVYVPAQVSHGKYLVELLGCASCHTDGALVGTPDFSRYMAGSGTGIAWSDPMRDKNPGIVYPANLTPDMETGLGTWTDEAILGMIQSGTNPSGGHSVPVMPWPAYAKINNDDLQAIVAYLRNLPAVKHKVPENVAPGRPATAPFVYFGVYQSITW